MRRILLLPVAAMMVAMTAQAMAKGNSLVRMTPQKNLSIIKRAELIYG